MILNLSLIRSWQIPTRHLHIFYAIYLIARAMSFLLSQFSSSPSSASISFWKSKIRNANAYEIFLSHSRRWRQANIFVSGGYRIIINQTLKQDKPVQRHLLTIITNWWLFSAHKIVHCTRSKLIFRPFCNMWPALTLKINK